MAIEIDESRAPAEIRPADPGDSRWGAPVHEGAVAAPEIKRVRLVRVIGDDEVDVTVVVEIARVDAHAGAGPTVVVESDAALDAALGELPR